MRRACSVYSKVVRSVDNGLSEKVQPDSVRHHACGLWMIAPREEPGRLNALYGVLYSGSAWYSLLDLEDSHVDSLIVISSTRVGTIPIGSANRVVFRL
jgi:hypothetical protein